MKCSICSAKFDSRVVKDKKFDLSEPESFSKLRLFVIDLYGEDAITHVRVIFKKLMEVREADKTKISATSLLKMIQKTAAGKDPQSWDTVIIEGLIIG